MSIRGSKVNEDELSAIGEAMAAIRTAPPEQRAVFWHGIRDMIDDQMCSDAPEFRPQPPKPAGLVYYIRFGDRVKIGYTTNLPSRLRALPHDEVLATEPGTMQDERARHAEFADLRLIGEWFDYAEPLQAHVASLAS